MIPWSVAYNRCKKNKEFLSYFGAGAKEEDFRSIAYCQAFTTVAAATAASTTSIITPGTLNGPLQQNFSVGGIILGITASAAAQQFVGAGATAFQYEPSPSPGLRNLFAMNLAYTGTEQLTPGGPVLADALLGGGDDTIFPPREIVVPPSQGILCAIQSMLTNVAMTVNVVYHTMIIKAAM